MTLRRFLVAFGFVQWKADPTLYAQTHYGAFAMIVVYVDDILMLGDSDGLPDLVVKYFKWSFEVQVYPKCEKFLRFSVQDSGDTVELYSALTIPGL